MKYAPPAFVEIKMDAEVGSYQDDFDFDDPLHQRDASNQSGLRARKQARQSAKAAPMTMR